MQTDTPPAARTRSSIGGPGLAVRLEGIGVTFPTPGGPVEALRDCSIEIAAGSFTAVIGPNGCGKSTLLRVMAGLVEPHDGEVAVGGARPRAGDGRVGIAFQQPRLMPWRSALDNVALPLELAGMTFDERRRSARTALERVGLAHAAALRPSQLSGGMQQRASLARALIGNPPVLLLDEPFSALDALTREAFNLQLEQLWIDQPRTLVLVTHSVGEAIQLADRVAVMTARPGRVASVIEVVLPRPRPPDLLGDPRAARLAERVRALLGSVDAEPVRPWAEDSSP